MPHAGTRAPRATLMPLVTVANLLKLVNVRRARNQLVDKATHLPGQDAMFNRCCKLNMLTLPSPDMFWEKLNLDIGQPHYEDLEDLKLP